MSGHSKWASIKHKKALTDSKRGKVFTKLIRELTMAAKEGGGNQDANPRLRTAILKAKEANMPGDNIDRAIKRGTGELPGVIFEQIIYEGYGPHGVAVMVETFTDNKNRTSSDVRNIFLKKGGNLGGSVAWLFHKKGYIMVNKSDADEDKLMSIALDNGAEDFTIGENSYEVTTDQRDFEKVRSAIVDAKIPIQASEITMIPTSTIKLTGEHAKQVLSLVEELEDHDDVQNVYANFDIPDTILTQSAEEEKSKG